MINHDPVETTQEDEALFLSLRAQSWSEFYGQKNAKHALQTALVAAKKRKEPLEHVLLYGPPGLGKTTLSQIIAKEMESNIRITSGPALTHSSDVASILTNLEQGDVLFIDEIHRLNTSVEELLYTAMEDYCLDIIVGKGPGARTVRIDLPRFTIIGATTRAGMLSSPLRDRFGHVHRMEYYEPEDLTKILKDASKKMQFPVTDTLLLEIGKRSRGTPRIALKLLKRTRDVSQVHGTGSLSNDSLLQTFSMLEIDELGLDQNDRRYMESIMKFHKGGPVGIETLAATLSEDVETLEDILEPYLMQIGFLKRTPKGRMITEQAKTHIAKKPSFRSVM